MRRQELQYHLRLNWTLKCVNWTVVRTVVHVVSSFLFSLDAYIIYFEAIARKIFIALFVKNSVKIRMKFKWFDRSIQLKFGPNFFCF